MPFPLVFICISIFVASIFMYLDITLAISVLISSIISGEQFTLSEINNIFNLSLGGLICECFNMVSSAIYLLRLRKEEKQAQN